VHISKETIVTQKADIVCRNIYKSKFLIDITDNYLGDRCALYEINETGMFIWNCIDGKNSIEQLALLLRNAIIDDIDFDLILEDVIQFIISLCSNCFVVVVNNG